MTKGRSRIIVILCTILFSLIALLSTLFAGLTVMMFGDGDFTPFQEGVGLFNVATMQSFTGVAAASLVGAWMFYARQRYRIAAYVALLPLINIALYGITLAWLFAIWD